MGNNDSKLNLMGMIKLIKIALATATILYILPLIAVYFMQRRFLYFPPAAYLSPADVQLSAVEVGGGQNGAAHWWLPPSGTKPVIMFFHGNGSAVYTNHNIYRDLGANGYGLLAMRYPGYPSPAATWGNPSQTAIVDGAVNSYDWLTAQGVAAERIVFYGTSLGSGIAAQLATKRRPSKIILEAPFNSAVDIGQASMPIFPVRLFMKDTYRSDLALQGQDMPLIWLHGSADNVIPLSQGQKLYDNYSGPKTYKIFDGGQHTNLWALGGREFVLAQLESR